jgi:hypothetical protein
MKTKTEKTEAVLPPTKELETELATIQRFSVPTVKSVEDRQSVESALLRIKTYLASVDAVFGESLDSAKATVKAINKQMKHFAGPAEDLQSSLRAALSVYLTAEQRKAETRAAKLVERLEKKGDVLAAQAVVPARVTGEDVGSRKVWSAVIENPKLLPAEYWIVDVERLNREARALKELFSVPGARADWRATAVV